MGITVGKSYDLNAAEFFNATQILTPVQKQAVNELVVDLKGYGIWSKMKAVYPMVGQAGVSSSFSYNLKDINAFRGTFSGSWVFSSTGATPDGTTAYMDTGLSPSTSLTSNNTSIGIYNQTPTEAPKPDVPIGIIHPTVNNPILFIRFYTNVYQSSQYDINTFGNYFQTSWSPDYNELKGFWASSRTANNIFKLYKNESLLGTKTYTESLDITTLTHSITIAALNRGTSQISYDSTTKSFAFIGDGLTDTDASNLYTAVQRFQTTLGRQV